MKSNILLPRKAEDLGRVIYTHLIREENNQQVWRTLTKLATYYAMGYRRFDTINLSNQTVHHYYLEEDGKLGYQDQQLLYESNEIMGALGSMNVRPLIEKNGGSLEAMRERAAAQVIMDNVIDDGHLDEVTKAFDWYFTYLGSCGLACQMEDVGGLGLTAELEVVHPFELLPFPSIGNNLLNQRGLIRKRVIPRNFLNDIYGKAKVNHWWKVDKLRSWSIQTGDKMETLPDGGYTAMTGNVLRTGGNNNEESMDVAEVWELWLDGPRGTCTRYVVGSGEQVFEDQDYEGLAKYAPITHQRFYENGTFYGCGHFHMRFASHRESEKLRKALFSNIYDADRYGVLVLPQGTINDKTAMRDVGHGLKYLKYMPAPIEGNARPFAVAPANSGTAPAQVAAFAEEMGSRMNPIRDILKEKGRADSAAAIQQLTEEARRGLTIPTQGKRDAFSRIYRATGQMAAEAVQEVRGSFPANRLTIDLLGVVIDPETDEINFNANPIPYTGHLRFTIQHASAISPLAKKLEAMQHTNEGRMHPADFAVYAVQEGLEPAMWVKDVEAAVRSVTRNILLLYGDGEFPGQVIVTPEQALPEVQLRILSAVLSSPEMGRASVAVQDEFIKYSQFLQQQMGSVLPAQVPNPDDALVLQEAAMQAQAMLPQSEGAPA